MATRKKTPEKKPEELVPDHEMDVSNEPITEEEFRLGVMRLVGRAAASRIIYDFIGISMGPEGITAITSHEDPMSSIHLMSHYMLAASSRAPDGRMLVRINLGPKKPGKMN